jgi:hypothetical protein
MVFFLNIQWMEWAGNYDPLEKNPLGDLVTPIYLFRL